MNKLIQGKLIYDEQSFAVVKPYLSGDTLKLLRQPAGSDVARMNRLLLEDAFPLDIMRRPKILYDAAAQSYFFIDFAKKTVSLYEKDGEKKWTADLGPTIANIIKESQAMGMMRYRDTSMIPVTRNNFGIFDFTRWPRIPVIRGTFLVEFTPRDYGKIELRTGDVMPMVY